MRLGTFDHVSNEKISTLRPGDVFKTPVHGDKLCIISKNYTDEKDQFNLVENDIIGIEK